MPEEQPKLIKVQLILEWITPQENLLPLSVTKTTVQLSKVKKTVANMVNESFKRVDDASEDPNKRTEEKVIVGYS